MYVVLTGLCAMMCMWILGFPGTWRGGWAWHDALIDKWARNTQKSGHLVTPKTLLTKYKGHPVAQLCHILPGAVWAGLIPFQLYPGMRKSFRKAHRAGGYLFAGTAYLMMVGFAYIDVKGLLYIHADFPHIPAEHNTTALPVHVPHEPVFRGVAAWFLITISLAVWHAAHRRFSQHRKWILRHIASGIWVAVQRLYVGISNGKTPAEQKIAFGDGAVVGVVLCCAAAELAVWGYEEPRAPKRKVK